MSGPAAGAEGARGRARAPDEETRYRAVGQLDPADAADRALLLELLADGSWRVRAAAVDRIGAAADPGLVLPALVAALSGGQTVGARDAAASALERIGAPAVPALLAAFGEGEPDLRLAAVAVLGAIGDRRAAAPVAARLADPDPNVRAAAAEALGRIGGDEAVATLGAAIESDDPTLRLAALEALGRLRACPAPARLAPMLSDRILRLPVYRLLGASDDPLALQLLGCGIGERARAARDAALAGIGQQRLRRPRGDLVPLEWVARAAALRDTGLADACAVALADAQDSLARVGAVTVLAWIAAPRHVRTLLRRAEDEQLRPLVEEALAQLPADRELKAALAEAASEAGPYGRAAALAALARLGSPAALESVIREASDPDSEVQGEAIAALGTMGDPRSISALAGLLGDDAPEGAARAAEALVRIGAGSPEALRAVRAEARGRAAASPSAAVYRLLGRVGEAADAAPIRAGLRAPCIAHRVAAAGALARLADRGLLAGARAPELVAALGDEAWTVRAAAARALASLAGASRVAAAGGPRAEEGPDGADALAALRRALGDPEPTVRAAAADALGATGRADQVAALAALLEAEGPPVVAVAVLRALAALGAAPLAALARAIRHGDPEVVKEAVAAAASAAGPEAEGLLREAAGSPRWDVRRAAAAAMAARRDPALAPDAERRAAQDPDPLVARAFAAAADALRRG